MTAYNKLFGQSSPFGLNGNEPDQVDQGFSPANNNKFRSVD